MGDGRRKLLERLAEDVRLFLEDRWREWHAHIGSPDLLTPSQGTCGRSSLLLRDVLRDAGFDAHFACGSPVEGARGYHAPRGWLGHAWVRVEGLIVDVTADQFGAAPVLITPEDDPRYAEGKDMAEEEFIARRQRMAATWLQHWRMLHEDSVTH